MVNIQKRPTEYFEIVFSQDKDGENKKFGEEEITKIIEAIKKTEDFLYKLLTFSSIPAATLYKTPIIFEKWKKSTHQEKFYTKYARAEKLPVGTKWQENIVVTSPDTWLVTLAPNYEEDLGNNISHECLHIFIESFLKGVNQQSNKFFIEALVEFMGRMSQQRKKTKTR